ncbi:MULTISPECIES: histidine phosphatase family protein [Streptomyces]|uniref:MSMEG_4193 family putative phosphomutase n=1 Tax=Streptomyces sudanensis TaxID=436397 RepID=A0ABY4TIE9_9ACTN|nr:MULTISPECIES: histidine phosphatase family protein [Streptomyces]MCP9959581.1 MSMEG_4193 family putative phosphomutase [Streptomyces sudanensis]MCP9988639.1 MSMEG_4193 family putative phosphomutase [Streptomyces sudanensis]MCP9999983.1 MSMEG_4193 family putative phosphomutase [Streptomyces sudanensis]URN17909.1 MSMEG_4193 family putative phosphomutase [Streptomyces sudanensis]
MATLILVRHGRSTANTAGVLAGRTPGVTLDERGAAQAAALPGRLDGVPLALAVSSPLERCRGTLAPLLAARPGLALHTEERINECDYGDWSGRKLAELADEPLMDVVQHHPSAAAFPGGESMRAMQARAVDAVRDWNARVADAHGDDAAYVMCSHGDIIKALVADALGLHLDLFQRLHVDPCSVTAIRYTRTRPFLIRLGDTGDLGALAPRDGDAGAAAQVGGGAGAP